MTDTFTLAEARALMPEVQKRAAELQPLRADLAEVGAAVRQGTSETAGGVPELKSLEARLHEALGWFTEQGIQVKGIAPLLIDFPTVAAGDRVLLCWLEGEHELAWYHRPDLGFMGRRPLSGLDLL